MAIVKQSIYGSISGKLGGIVGYELNGQNILRSVPSYTKRPPSAMEAINRAKMAAASKFLKPIKRIIVFGYKNLAPKGSRVGPFQTAQRHVFKEATEVGENSMVYVNPEKVFVFRGDLTAPARVEVVRQENGINITWDKKPWKEPLLLVLAYAPEKDYFLFEEGPVRAEEGIFNLSIPERVLSDLPHIHVYIGFYDIINDRLSDSVYGGCV